MLTKTIFANASDTDSDTDTDLDDTDSDSSSIVIIEEPNEPTTTPAQVEIPKPLAESSLKQVRMAASPL